MQAKGRRTPTSNFACQTVRAASDVLRVHELVRSGSLPIVQRLHKAAMAIKLLDALLGFRSSSNRESETAFFLAHVPWVGPEVYLHTIFKPAQSAALGDKSETVPAARQLGVKP
jgi:hypothetical protein